MPARIEQHRYRSASTVRPCDQRRLSVARWTTDDSVCADQALHKIRVEAVAKDRERHGGRSQEVFGGPVVVSEYVFRIW